MYGMIDSAYSNFENNKTCSQRTAREVFELKIHDRQFGKPAARPRDPGRRLLGEGYHKKPWDICTRGVGPLNG